MNISNLTFKLTFATLALWSIGFQARADQAKSDSYSQIESDFNSAQPISLAQLATYGEFSRSNQVTPATTEITTDPGVWSYYVVNVVEDDAAGGASTVLAKNYPLMAGPKAAQAVIRADNTMTVENMFNNKNLDCYDYSKLLTALVSQDTKDGVVLINSQRDFYRVSQTCTPKYDKITTTIKQSDLFLVIRTEYAKDESIVTVYNYGWK